MLYGVELDRELAKVTDEPIWKFCPYALDDTACPGTCSYDDQPGFRCSMLHWAEDNARAFIKGEPLVWGKHKCPIAKEA